MQVRGASGLELVPVVCRSIEIGPGMLAPNIFTGRASYTEHLARSSTTRRRVHARLRSKEIGDERIRYLFPASRTVYEQKIRKECEITRTRCHRPLIYRATYSASREKQLRRRWQNLLELKLNGDRCSEWMSPSRNHLQKFQPLLAVHRASYDESYRQFNAPSHVPRVDENFLPRSVYRGSANQAQKSYNFA